jgi:hypothetical protein
MHPGFVAGLDFLAVEVKSDLGHPVEETGKQVLRSPSSIAFPEIVVYADRLLSLGRAT